MKKIFIIVFIFFSSTLLFAEKFTVSNIMWNPKKIYVGDKVECKIIIKRDSSVIPTYKKSEIENPWIYIEDVKIINKNDESEISIIFYPYNIGLFLLPPIDFTDFTIKDIKMQIDSIGEDGDFVNDVAKPLYLPHTFVYIAILLILIIVLPILLIAYGDKIVHIINEKIKLMFKKNPYKELLNVCKQLKNNTKTLDSKVFYDTMIYQLRKYLTDRVGEDFFITTTSEAEKVLEEKYQSPEMISHRIAVIMEHSDEIRFSFKSENLTSEENDLQIILEVCSLIERKYNYGDEE